MKEMHLRTDRTLFDYIVLSLFETTSLSCPSSPLASSPIAFSPTLDMLDGTLLPFWMELPPFLKRGMAHIFRTDLGTTVCVVFNYAMDCWHIPRFVALGPTSSMVIIVSLERTARQNSQLCVIIMSTFFFIVAWTFPMASLQPGPRRLKVKHCWKFCYKDTYCAVPVL